MRNDRSNIAFAQCLDKIHYLLVINKLCYYVEIRVLVQNQFYIALDSIVSCFSEILYLL